MIKRLFLLNIIKKTLWTHKVLIGSVTLLLGAPTKNSFKVD